MHVKVFCKLLTIAIMIDIKIATLKELTIMLEGHDTHL